MRATRDIARRYALQTLNLAVTSWGLLSFSLLTISGGTRSGCCIKENAPLFSYICSIWSCTNQLFWNFTNRNGFVPF